MTQAQALAQLLRILFCCGTDERPEVVAEHDRIEQAGASFVSRNCHVITQEIEEAHRQEPYSPMDVPRIDRSEDDQLEGSSVPQTAGQKPKTDSKTTVNNAGIFHGSNLLHVNQGDYGTFTQGNSFSIGRNFFNVSGGTVQNVNEDGLSGAVLCCI